MYKNKITIISIGYNVENYLKRFLDSALYQEDENFDVIFVDDGSTDNTKKIAESYTVFKNFKYLYQNNQGLIAARKTGLNNATGEYVIFVDSDDYLEKNAICNYRGVLSKYLNNLPDIIITDFIRDFNGNLDVNKNRKEHGVFTEDEYLKAIMVDDIDHYMWDKMFKKSFVLKAGYLDLPNISMAEDWLANTILGCQRPLAVYEDIRTYYYCCNPTSMSQNENPKILEQEKTLEYIETYFKRKNLYNEYKDRIVYMWFSYISFILQDFSYNFKIKIVDSTNNRCISYKDNKYCVVLLENRKKVWNVLVSLFLNHSFLAKPMNNFLFYLKRIKSEQKGNKNVH